MEKTIFEQMGGTYYEENGYLIPDLILPLEEEPQLIGIWGQRHLRYLRKHKPLFYANLLTTGKLNSYLANIDKQSEEMFSQIIHQIAEHEGVTEQLKADNQLDWVRKINNIRNRAMEIINIDIIYTV